ncbi:carboxyltransferase [Saccharomonospora sp. NPDC046836]|uniref:carboxyltransferase n=1 Tax=Saccharomonospora sp. NPDC046836 TaxID=3156921 RepID=UPI0033F5CE36
MQVEFIDQTLRDGQQSLWGLRMRAYQATPALPYLDRAGYRVIDLTGAGMFTVLLRTFADDPFATLDHLVAGLRGNELRTATRTISVGGMGFSPDSVVDLWVKMLVKHGIGSFWIFDCLFDMPKMRRVAEVVHKEGAKPVPTVMYGLTDVHTDEFFATRAAEMATWPGVETVELEDAAGVLTPERARTLLPTVNGATGATPMELHCHSTSGMAPAVYLVGLESGISILHTCVKSMASGPSMPSVESMVANLEILGHTHNLDTSTFAPVSDHFAAEAARMGGAAAGYEVGVPNEFDLVPYQHQLPGGMTGSLKSQLAQYGMQDRLKEVLLEIPNVRRDLGEPIMATPFSQFVGIQALLNIVTGERYSLIPDEVIQYTLGQYGPLAREVEPNVKDRVLSSERAQQFANWTQPQPTLAELRNRFGKSISDEELLLRALFSGEEVDNMLAAGPIRTDPRTGGSEIVDHIEALIGEKRRAGSLSVTTPEFSVTLRKSTT